MPADTSLKRCYRSRWCLVEGASSDGSVAVASCAGSEYPEEADCSIVTAGCLAMQRLKAIRGVIVRTDIAKQGLPTGRGIAVTACVGRQSLIPLLCYCCLCCCCGAQRTGGRVFGFGRVVKKCNSSNRRVSSAVVFCESAEILWRCCHYPVVFS